MRGIFASLFVYFQLVVVLMAVVFTLIPMWLRIMGVAAIDDDWRYPLIAAGVLVYLLVIGAVLHAMFVGTLLSRSIPMPGYRFSIGVQIRSGYVWAAVLGLLFLASIPWVYGHLPQWASGLAFVGDSLKKTLAQAAAEIGAIAAALAGLGKTLHAGDALGGRGKKLVAKVTGISLLAFVLIYLLLLLAYGVSQSLAKRFPGPFDLAFVSGIVAVLTGYIGVTANLNFAGHHRMYRDRMMELFLPDEKTVDDNVWAPAAGANRLLLADVRTRPYHIINTNVVLVDSNVPRYRGRGGDSFILSPLRAGSSATGWCRTKDLRLPKVHGMTLSTAMAISGASLNPDTGAAGVGPTRKRLVSVLMTLLNIRLGYWTRGTRRPLSNRANYIFPGIRALFGVGFHEHARMLDLTDGGHFDNLGLYELIRRRVRTIVVSDAACDRAFSFNDLASVIERVRTDFGAIITFRTGETEDLAGIVPREEGSTEQTRGIRLARRGYAVADIAYDTGENGILLYIKSTLIAGLPLDVYDYKRKNDAFPHETTADQFFDERQFEAYRELGYHITKKALDDPNGPFPTWPGSRPYRNGWTPPSIVG
jgi:hypothetical protein